MKKIEKVPLPEGEFKIEISYFEKTKKGELRFAKFKRFLEG